MQNYRTVIVFLIVLMMSGLSLADELNRKRYPKALRAGFLAVMAGRWTTAAGADIQHAVVLPRLHYPSGIERGRSFYRGLCTSLSRSWSEHAEPARGFGLSAVGFAQLHRPKQVAAYQNWVRAIYDHRPTRAGTDQLHPPTGFGVEYFWTRSAP
jgi:hypothetical protein